MSSGWTQERKARQATVIQNWKPWTRAKGPKSLEGKAAVSQNAFKGNKRLLMRQTIKELNKYFLVNRELLGEL